MRIFVGLKFNIVGLKDVRRIVYGIRSNHILAVEKMVARGSDIEHKDQWGRTPLMLACSRNNEVCCKILVENGADVNARSKAGFTPIRFVTVHEYSYDIIRLLLENGADITSRDYRYGKTCLDFQKELWLKEAIQELIITKQSHNIKFFDDKIGILPHLREKYKEIIDLREKYKDVIELSLMGLF